MKNIILTMLLIFTIFTFATGCAENYKFYRNLNTPKGMYDKGIDLYVRSNYKEAIDTFLELMNKFPNAEKERAWAQYEIGFCYFHMGDHDKATASFRKVLDEHSLRAPRILAARMIIKIQKNDLNKRSSYVE